MFTRNHIKTWAAVVLALGLLAGACSSDSTSGASASESDLDSSESSGADSNDSSSSDTADDSASSDNSDDSDNVDDAGGDETPPLVTGEVDCEQIDNALSSAGGLVTGDMALFGNGNNREAQFKEAEATMLALKQQTPELADDVDKTLAGLDAIAGAFEEIGWDTDFMEDPGAAAQVARMAFSDVAVSEMIASVANIGIWIAANCSS